VDNDRIIAPHITDGDTGAEDYFTPGIDGVDHRVIENCDIPVGNDRALDTALAPDNGIPAADIKGDTGPGTKFKGSGYGQPSPEMGMGRNNKITVDLHIPFEI